MWFFNSPEVIFGEGALSHLSQIQGKKAFVVTDENIVRLGLAEPVVDELAKATIESEVYPRVEPEPSLDTARRGAEAAAAYQPDWIVGLGGGSAIDAAKAIWVLYERPDISVEGINPFEPLGLRQKARFITIPTTSGTGAEMTWLIVLTDPAEERKRVLGSRENQADYAIVDPIFVANLPPQIIADTGLDALTHAIEAYTSTWSNHYADGLSLQAIRMTFDYLLASHQGNKQAREQMHHAASIAGLALNNSQGALAHALGHSMGAVFHIPHGRTVAIFLPYSIQFTALGGNTRYADIARFLGWAVQTEEEGAKRLVENIRGLMKNLGLPLAVKELGIEEEKYRAKVEKMVETGENDTVSSRRVPDRGEMHRLFLAAYHGEDIDF